MSDARRRSPFAVSRARAPPRQGPLTGCHARRTRNRSHVQAISRRSTPTPHPSKSALPQHVRAFGGPSRLLSLVLPRCRSKMSALSSAERAGEARFDWPAIGRGRRTGLAPALGAGPAPAPRAQRSAAPRWWGGRDRSAPSGAPHKPRPGECPPAPLLFLPFLQRNPPPHPFINPD